MTAEGTPDSLFVCTQVANAVRYEVAAAAANIIGTEQPCRVRLRLWHCSAADPTASLEVPSLTIPDAVLCSEMGVHFSACGRFLAACVACQVCPILIGCALCSSSSYMLGFKKTRCSKPTNCNTIASMRNQTFMCVPECNWITDWLEG